MMMTGLEEIGHYHVTDVSCQVSVRAGETCMTVRVTSLTSGVPNLPVDRAYKGSDNRPRTHVSRLFFR